MPKKLTQESILRVFNRVHNNKYDYSLCIFKNTSSKIKIICKKHGIFEQTPNHHSQGQGCPKCLGKNYSIDEIKNDLIIKHNNKYNYSLFDYFENKKQNIKIICPTHGEFKQKISKHLSGQGCPKCAKVYKYTTSEFIEQCKKLNNDYDYSLVNYIDNRTNIKIICNIHGIFEQSPNNHLRGQSCPYCKKHKNRTDFFIKKVSEIHENKYDYLRLNYIDSKTKIIVTCKIHGDFETLPNSHLKGSGCPICSGNKKLSNDEFIKQSKIINGDKFDYSLVKYKRGKDKVKIICPKHGIFEQTPNLHINHKHGCPKCAGKNRTTSEFIDISNQIHNNKYHYNLVEYKKSNEKVKIVCPEHGLFEQNPNHHLRGQGCPICNLSKGENKIISILKDMNLKYKRQYSFDGCKYNKKLQFDFYLPKYNICIEYDGIQHFKPIDFFGGIKAFEETKIKDSIKNEYCKNNKIKLIRIPYYEQVDKYINNLNLFKNMDYEQGNNRKST